MIYTVTFNPSLDYIIRLESELQVGDINRTSYDEIIGGGKGINVSIVLKNLGIESIALGFIAGFTGREIERQLQEKEIKTDFIHLSKGNSRINVKLKYESETAINGQGPIIDDEAREKLFAQLDKIKKSDTVVLAGSIPNTLPDDIYEKIMAHLAPKNINFVVDATQKLLLNVLKYHPFLIKPNIDELGELFAVKINNHDDIILYAKRLQNMGARHVLVSMGGDGAILLTAAGEVYNTLAPQGILVNSVGAGDSSVAGFLAGLSQNPHDVKHAFYLAIAAGSASAFSPYLATLSDTEKLLKEIEN